jgi:hypothetical protein
MAGKPREQSQSSPKWTETPWGDWVWRKKQVCVGWKWAKLGVWMGRSRVECVLRVAMMTLASIRVAGLWLGLGAGVALGQGALPATAPTSMAAAPVAAGPAASLKADVSYTGGMLQVKANNSSLNQILREIGRLTGMKITGGVAEDRVFGNYGPAPASQVILTLLDGMASNVMIVENSAAGPAELILTPRSGGVTPPNPNASRFNDEQAGQQNNRLGGGPPRGVYIPPPQPQYTPPVVPAADSPVSNGNPVNTDNPPAASAPAPAAVPASGDGTQPQSPNGVSTPQQIYEQLQKLRSQQPASPQ